MSLSAAIVSAVVLAVVVYVVWRLTRGTDEPPTFPLDDCYVCGAPATVEKFFPAPRDRVEVEASGEGGGTGMVGFYCDEHEPA